MTIEERQRRMRAARGYAGFSHADLAERLGIGRDTVQRFEAGREVHPIEEEVMLRRIAEVCGLPYAFFLVEFERLPVLVVDEHDELLIGSGPEETRVQRLEAAIDTLASEHNRLQRAMESLTTKTTVSRMVAALTAAGWSRERIDAFFDALGADEGSDLTEAEHEAMAAAVPILMKTLREVGGMVADEAGIRAHEGATDVPQQEDEGDRHASVQLRIQAFDALFRLAQGERLSDDRTWAKISDRLQSALDESGWSATEQERLFAALEAGGRELTAEERVVLERATRVLGESTNQPARESTS